MEFLAQYGKEIVAILVPLVTWLANNYLRANAKLQLGMPHQFTFLVQQPLYNHDGTVKSPTQTVKTNSYILKNAGRMSATKVEMVFNWKPLCLNIWPLRHFEEHLEADGRYVIVFDSLSPGEVQGVELLEVNQVLPELINARSKECVAKSISMYPLPIVSRTMRTFFAVMFGLGVGLSVYLVITVLQFLVLKTPF